MSELQFSRTVFYNGREVITASEFSTLIRSYPGYVVIMKRATTPEFPALAVKKGRREYYYFDDLMEWYEEFLKHKAEQIKKYEKNFDRVKEVNKLKQGTNRESRQALLDAIRSKGE